MHAKVVTAPIQKDKLEQAKLAFESRVLPAVSKRPGFEKGYVLLDRERSEMTAVTLWTRREDVERLDSSGFYREQVAKLEEVLAGTPKNAIAEVALFA